MRNGQFMIGVLCALAISGPAFATSGNLPNDVPGNHWAAGAVQQMVSNGVMSLGTGHKFYGDEIVTHTQAVIALSKLAHSLEQGKWHTEASTPVSAPSVIPTLARGAWKQRPLTRYALASILARFGDYFANGVPRPDAGATDTGKSEAMWNKPQIKASKTNPAYESLTYLAANRMILPTSSLLKPDRLPIKASEMSEALSVLAVGLVDRLTSIGHDAQGNTHDEAFHKKSAEAKH